MDVPLIKKGIASFRPVAGRLQYKNMEGVIFLDDSYNSNPDSFKASLDALRDLKIRERRGVVCGDMLELGENAERLHRELGAYLARLLFDYVIAAGPLSKSLVDEAVKNGFDPKRIFHVKDSIEAGRVCRETAVPGDRVLVKGSRGMQMEKVFECFITSSTP
jgi:UDP-N-acetylmuramoyl-tripeptide--D-alanyl-D-alanine ligase